MTKEPIVDSNLTREEASAQDPNKPACPPEILAQLQLVTVHYYGFDGKLHRGQIVVNEELAGDILEFFELARELEFPFAKVVPNAAYEYNAKKLAIDHNVTYGFGYRTIKGTDTLSLHAYGRAIDINPVQNPYIRYPKGKAILFPPNSQWNPKQPGTLHKDHELVKFMENERGWEWGGHWTRQDGVTDYMHLQKEPGS